MSSILLLASLVGLLFKNFRPKAKWIAPISLAAVIASVALIGNDMDSDARSQGFLDSADKLRAQEAGITDGAKWTAMRKQTQAIANEQKAKEEQRRADLIRQPQEQIRFVQAITDAKVTFAEGKNDLQRGAARATRARSLCAIPKLPILDGWVGTIEKLSSNSDGKGVLYIRVANGVSMGTWNNAFSDLNYGTLIVPDSALHNSLLRMNVGDTVRFSGSMLSSESDCYLEQSLTQSGSIREPIFVVRFSRVQQIVLDKK